MDDTATYDYLQIISEGNYVGRSQMGTCHVYRVGEDFFLVNKGTGETKRIQDEKVVFKHLAAKTLLEEALI